MNSFDFLIVVSILLAPNAMAFDLNSLDNVPVTKRAICYPYICLEAEKDGLKYLVVEDDRSDDIIFVFLVEGKDLKMIYARDRI